MSTRTRSLIDQLHNSRWREILLSQLDESKDEYSRHTAIWQPLSEAEKLGHLKSNLAPDDHDCELLVRIALIGEFPPSDPWMSAGREILNWFWTVRHPSFAPVIAQHYGDAADDCRGSALVVLCCQESAAATDLMVRLIAEHGLPHGHCPPRFFWELNKRHTSVAPRLFPDLLFRAGDDMAGVMNYLNLSLEQGHLTAEALRPAAGWIATEAAHLLDQVEPLQQSEGTKWRIGEEYFPLRSKLGVHLDLLGTVDAPAELLQRAARLKDPRLLMFAIVAMMKRGMEPARASVELCANSLESRSDLYRQLKALGKLESFPRELLTFESFAAASMADWLLYPAELGYEPAALELMAQVEGVQEEKPVVLCLWKFTTEEGEAFASASGPYPASRPVEPLWGPDTFSNFTEWDKLSPEQHLEGILETLENWSIAWSEGRM